MFSYVSSGQTFSLKTVFLSSCIFLNILCGLDILCRKLSQTLVVIPEFIPKFCLIGMFLIVHFWCTPNSYFLLVVLLAMFMSSKFGKCFWCSNSTVYFLVVIQCPLLYSIYKNLLHLTFLEVICEAFECFWDNLVIRV